MNGTEIRNLLQTLFGTKMFWYSTFRKYVRSASSPASIKKKEGKETLELSYKKQGMFLKRIERLTSEDFDKTDVDRLIDQGDVH